MKKGRPRNQIREKARCVEVADEYWEALKYYGGNTRKAGIKNLVDYARDSGFIPLTKGKNENDTQ